MGYLCSPTGRVTVVQGKDSSQVRWNEGTGGLLSHYPEPTTILIKPRAEERGDELFPPTSVAILINRDYVMSSVAVIAEN